MSKVTDENFIGADATIVGYVRGYDTAVGKSGENGFMTVAIPIDDRYKKGDEWVSKGTTWFRYTAKPDYLDGAKVGDKVRVEGAQQGRPFLSEKGNVYVDLSWGTLTVLESAPADDDEAPF